MAENSSGFSCSDSDRFKTVGFRASRLLLGLELEAVGCSSLALLRPLVLGSLGGGLVGVGLSGSEALEASESSSGSL